MRIYVRERTKSRQGAHQPRYIIIAVAGGDLRLYARHFRKLELERLASDCGAELCYLEPMTEEEHDSPTPG